MYRVSKVLNNNGVIAINMEENIEYVLLGKGIGFGKKISQRFEAPDNCTRYSLKEDTERGAQKNWQKAFLRNIWRSQMKFCKKQR
ncbi:MAG: CAT RNA binding domain-containing protein [Mediterraneibacter gnavus]